MLKPTAENVPALVPRRSLWRQLYVQVLAAILLGVLVGMLAPEAGVAMKPLGDGFIKLVNMIIAPVIFLSIVTGIARSRELRGVEARPISTLSCYDSGHGAPPFVTK